MGIVLDAGCEIELRNLARKVVENHDPETGKDEALEAFAAAVRQNDDLVRHLLKPFLKSVEAK
jgi:hypothetical protein